MDRRVELQSVLEEILGSNEVYYQRPNVQRMNYPAIVYNRSSIYRLDADNEAYKTKVGYTITLIDPNPDSSFINPLLNLPYCRYDRHYISDNLNHEVFTIYY